MAATMHRFIVFAMLICASKASEGPDLTFEEEPSSSVSQLGDRLRLRCKSNSPDAQITWYFNDVKLTSSLDTSDARKQRKKRNKEDRLYSNSYIAQFDNELAAGSSSAARSSFDWQNDAYRFSNPKKFRRRNERRRKNRKRKSHDHLSNLKTAKRYVRSVRSGGVDLNKHGIQIRTNALSIQKLNAENAGHYHCVATTPGGSIRSKSAWVKLAGISNFTFVPPDTVTALGSESVVLPCKLPESVPPALARWRLNDKTWIQESSETYYVLPSGGLLIKNVTSLSGSEFKCAAYNPITKEVKISSLATTLSVKESDVATRPKILYPTDDTIEVTAADGERIFLECVSSDLSIPSWKKMAEEPLSDDITAEGLWVTASASANGTYRCYSSPLSRSVTYHLTVLETPVVVHGSSSTVDLGDKNNATLLKCNSESFSPAVTWKWYFNGNKSEHARGNSLEIYADNGLSTGYYQCFAENREGSEYVVFQVNDQYGEQQLPTVTTSDEYFSASLDADGITRPTITSPQRTHKPTSYRLAWVTSGYEDNIKLFSIKYFKTPDLVAGGTPISYGEKYVNVPADRRELFLRDLEPSTTYILEMVAISKADGRSELAISSFETGRGDEAPGKPPLQTPRREKTNNPRKSKGRSKPPRAPSQPTVTGISSHKVSLMWNARGNGGSPIQGYRIESKKIGKKEKWKIMVGLVTNPPFEITNLERGVIYKFRIIAVNAHGDSDPSSSSPAYPKRTAIELKPLHSAPYIVETTTQGETDIIITWKYVSYPVSSIGGYFVLYRPSDSDDEGDYVHLRVNNPTATSYVIHHLEPEMQYDIKIQAYNSLGRSPFSNVMIIEMPKRGTGRSITVVQTPPGVDTDIIVDKPDHNEPAREKAYQRNTIFLITGAVIGLVLIVLLITVFCYWRRKSRQNAERSPELKQRNGYIAGRATNQINMTKLNSNGKHTPNGSSSPSPHDSRCQCSRRHSNRSSLGRDGADYPPYPMPFDGEHMRGPYTEFHGPGKDNWNPENYPRIYSNPLRMYPYFPHGMGRGVAVPGGPPIWWVRGNNGEFCHIVPGDARKMSGTEEVTDVCGTYPVGGGAMVMRTFDGNVTTGYYDESMQRPDNGYHSNEDGTRTNSDSQAERSDDAPHPRDDSSVGGATSGVATNDVTSESRPSSKLSQRSCAEERGEGAEKMDAASDDEPSDDVTDKMLLQREQSESSSTNCEEKASFLSNNDDGRKETLIT